MAPSARTAGSLVPGWSRRAAKPSSVPAANNPACSGQVRRATPNEGDLWAHSVGRGFFEQTELTTEEMDVGRWVFGMPGAMCYLACAAGGKPAGGAALIVTQSLGTLFADGVARPYRRQRLHQELIAARLNEALAQGCDVAAAATAPAGASQRNFERLGFQVVYTRVTLTK